MTSPVEYQSVYTLAQEKLIASEFSRTKDCCYLEHAGTTLYSERQIADACAELRENMYANPHALNTFSKTTDDAVDQIRYQILQQFNTDTDEYSVVFTSGATAALKIVAETFDYKNGEADPEGGTLVYLEDNHTSVLGMREYSPSSQPISPDEAFQILSSATAETSQLPSRSHQTASCGAQLKNVNSLYVYPAQSNFSGSKYPLSWIGRAQRGFLNGVSGRNSRNWFCLLDAAAYVSTNALDLSEYKPDFICVSFYKMFGYPTGLGALMVRKSSEHVLQKMYFGGGTVLMAVASQRIHVPRTVLHERFEDGTLPFLSILALRHGFRTLKRLSLDFDLISKHTFNLAQYVYRCLLRLHHNDGSPAVVLYHDTHFEDRKLQGGIVNFNILRTNGDYVGYAEVLHIADLYRIHLRTGCFCNPGACQTHLKLTPEDVKRHFEAGISHALDFLTRKTHTSDVLRIVRSINLFENRPSFKLRNKMGHVCGDKHDLVDGYPTGSVRISFGYMSTKKDADTLISMIEDSFVTKPILYKLPDAPKETQKRGHETPENEKGRRVHEKLDQPSISDVHSGLQIQCDRLSGNYGGVGAVKAMFVYPIKSCAPFAVSDWEFSTTGFKYDREWMIVNSAGVCVTQKQDTRLCLIKPLIRVEDGLLEICFEGMDSVSVQLDRVASKQSTASKCQSKVCGDRIQGWDCGDRVAEWLCDVLGIPGVRLLRQSTEIGSERNSKTKENSKLALANKAQFLLINTASVQWLLDRIPANDLEENLHGLIARFRPNFVVTLETAFGENEFGEIKIGNVFFKCHGQCTRCQMICIDQMTGAKTVEPLRTLSRAFSGKISFGIYLSLDSVQQYYNISVGDVVAVSRRQVNS